MNKQNNTKSSMHQTNNENKLCGGILRNKVGRKANGGFTLVELIVVIVIMGILTAAILPTVTGYVASAREQVAESNQHMVEQAAHLYLTNWEMDNGASAGTTITASDLVNDGYLSELPDGEDYSVVIAKEANGRYSITVTPTVGAEPEEHAA